MHQCLTINEIIEVIFEYVDGHEYVEGLPTIKCRKKSALTTLAALACTCKTFRDLAQDVLWREIPDIFVLIRYLFPKKVRNYRASEGTLCLTSQATEATWGRLDKFVTRIRLIGRRLPYLDAVPGRRIILDGPSVLEPLEYYLLKRFGRPGFPNLAHVIFQFHWAHPAYMRLLLLPQVLTVRCYMDTFGDEIQDSGVMPRCLYDSYYGEHGEDESVSRLIADAVGGMPLLRSVWLRDELLAEHPILAHLASLSTLEELCVDSHYACPDISILPTTSRFSSLRRLFLTAQAYTAEDFLPSMNTASLESLTLRLIRLYVHQHAGAREVRRFLSILSTTRAPRLQHIKAAFAGDELKIKSWLIGKGPCRAPCLRSVAQGPDYLRLLCEFTALRVIELELEAVLQLNDAFLTELASSLPHLEHLSLIPRPLFAFKIAEGTELPTFSGLLALVEHCPRLSILRLAVRTAMPNNENANAGLLSSDSMRIFDLLTTPVSDGVETKAVSTFLRSTFPNLERFRVALLAADDQCFPARERERACAQWSCIVKEVLEGHRNNGIKTDGASWYVE